MSNQDEKSKLRGKKGYLDLRGGEEGGKSSFGIVARKGVTLNSKSRKKIKFVGQRFNQGRLGRRLP